MTFAAIILLLISHLLVAFIAFQFGGLAAVQLARKEMNKSN